MIQKFLQNLKEFFKTYPKKEFLSPGRKIYLELHFGKKNLVGFSLSEIIGNNYKHRITNIYFYPSTNVYKLLFLEMKSKKFLITREVSKTLLLCFSIVQFLNKNFRGLENLGKNKLFLKKLKKLYKNIKIYHWYE